jgi:hypothetical protein
MGPRRSGVGGQDQAGMDIKHADIKNAATLVELIKPESNNAFIPSFGIHFLLDLVESDIHYLPVFPEDEAASFNDVFLRRSKNLLEELLPEYAFLADAVRVIDVAAATNGKVIQILMNAELGEAVALFTDPDEEIGRPEQEESYDEGHPESYWRWRYRMAEQIASHLDAEMFGVSGFYLFGSTKNGTAGPASDIDVLVHFRGNTSERERLIQWLDGWSLCLDEINYLRTGYRSGGLLDVHIVTDEDIAKRTSYAVKIGAVTDAARPLKLKDSDPVVPETQRV